MEATFYSDFGLHGRVQTSDIVVLARVVDPASALVSVEQVYKGDPPKQFRLVEYVDRYAIPAQQKVLVANADVSEKEGRRVCARAGAARPLDRE